MFGDAPLEPARIADAVVVNWSVEIDTIEYARIGYGSYHWHLRAGGGARWLVTADRRDSRPVVEAYDLAYLLGHELAFVRAPEPTSAGRAVVALGGWWLSLWPWLEGRLASAGERSTDDLARVAQCLRRLHDYAEQSPSAALTEDWAVPNLDELLPIADGVAVPGSGPYTAEVCARSRANAAAIRRDVARYRALVDTASRHAFVLTHGEPHAGNVVYVDGAAHLIDWDTVRWAPRERDLWDLGESVTWREAYGRDVEPSEDALEVYRLQWLLVELADFVPSLVAAPAKSADLDVAMEEVRTYLPL